MEQDYGIKGTDAWEAGSVLPPGANTARIPTIARTDNRESEMAYMPTQQGQVAWFYATHIGRPAPAAHDALTYLLEEVNELIVALEQGATDEEILKEIQDVRFTLAGYEVARGWNGHGAFQAVVESNMSKPPATDGQKVPKGENYVTPDMRPFLNGGTK